MTREEQKSNGELSYESWAARYAARIEHNPYNALYETPATRSLLPRLMGRHVLDAGCGPGQNSAWMLAQGAARVVACDVTPAFVELAAKQLKPYGERAAVYHADLTEPLSFAGDGQFDVVLSQLVMHYLKEWEPTFREFWRVLKPGGVFVFSTGHPLGDYPYATRYIGPHSYFDTVAFEAVWGGWGEPKPVIRSYRRPLADMLNPLIRAGFRLDHVLEAQPTEEFLAVKPDYDPEQKLPSFICFRAVKMR